MEAASSSNIEAAKTEFFTWWTNENRLGEGNYSQEIEKVRRVAQGLPTADLTLYRNPFRWGFTYFYGQEPGQRNFVPISFKDGAILRWQAANEGGSWWPIKDTETNAYYSPNVTNEDFEEHTGSETSGQFFYDKITRAYRDWRKGDRDNRTYLMLQALTPYAKNIQESVSEETYRQLVEMVPEFPPLQPAPEPATGASGSRGVSDLSFSEFDKLFASFNLHEEVPGQEINQDEQPQPNASQPTVERRDPPADGKESNSGQKYALLAGAVCIVALFALGIGAGVYKLTR